MVYDSIGKDTFPASLDCLKPLGMWVSFGQSSGPVPEFRINLLAQKGSLFAARPSLANYTATRKDLVATANDLFDVIAKGKVKIPSTRPTLWPTQRRRSATWKPGSPPGRPCCRPERRAN